MHQEYPLKAPPPPTRFQDLARSGTLLPRDKPHVASQYSHASSRAEAATPSHCSPSPGYFTPSARCPVLAQPLARRRPQPRSGRCAAAVVTYRPVHELDTVCLPQGCPIAHSPASLATTSSPAAPAPAAAATGASRAANASRWYATTRRSPRVAVDCVPLAGTPHSPRNHLATGRRARLCLNSPLRAGAALRDCEHFSACLPPGLGGNRPRRSSHLGGNFSSRKDGAHRLGNNATAGRSSSTATARR